MLFLAFSVDDVITHHCQHVMFSYCVNCIPIQKNINKKNIKKTQTQMIKFCHHKTYAT